LHIQEIIIIYIVRIVLATISFTAKTGSGW
jgi:hypothetical protein